MTRTKLALTAVGLAAVLVAAGLAADGPAPARSGTYSVNTDHGSAILLDSTTGRTWVLQQSPGNDPAWVPVKGPEQTPSVAAAVEPAAKSAPATPKTVPAGRKRLAGCPWLRPSGSTRGPPVWLARSWFEPATRSNKDSR